MQSLIISKLKHIKECFLLYKGLGVTTQKAFFSALLKIPVHSLMFRYQHLMRRYIIRKKFDYENGIWLTFHFGLNQFRPLLIAQKSLYLRGQSVPYVEPYTPNHVSYFHIDLNTKILAIMNEMKQHKIICGTIDGSLGSYDKFIQIGAGKVKYNSTLIYTGHLLKQRVFFELYYLDYFFSLRRNFCELSPAHFEEEIKSLYSKILINYPHNSRINRIHDG